LSKKFIVRLISYQNTKIVNICDEELLNRKLKEGNLVVDINEEYFSGFLASEEDAIRLVRESDIVNLVGNRIVEAVLKEKLAHPGAVRKISNISFLMIYKFKSK